MRPVVAVAALMLVAAQVRAGAPPAKAAARAVIPRAEGGRAFEELFSNEEILRAVPPRPLRVGEWVRYRFRDRTRTIEGFVRIALVPPAMPPGQPFWVEVTSGEGTNTLARMKYLTRDLVLAPGHLQRVLIDMKDMPPIDLPAELLNEPLPEEAYPLRAQVKKAGRERVQVRAVSCNAVKLELRAGKERARLWMCPDEVPIYGLVKAEDRDGLVELVEMGDGAVSEIDTPRD